MDKMSGGKEATPGFVAVVAVVGLLIVGWTWSKLSPLVEKPEPAATFVDSKGRPITIEQVRAYNKREEELKKALKAASPRDTGSKGSRGVPGNLDCQFYAQYGDDEEVGRGSARGRAIVSYVGDMRRRCAGGVTLVAPDGGTYELK